MMGGAQDDAGDGRDSRHSLASARRPVTPIITNRAQSEAGESTSMNKFIRILKLAAVAAALIVGLASAAQATTVTNVQTLFSTEFSETNYVVNVVTGTVASVTLTNAAAGYRNWSVELANLSTSAVMAVTTSGQAPSATVGQRLQVYSGTTQQHVRKIDRVGGSTLKINCLGAPTDMSNQVIVTERYWLDTTTTTYP
jgi:hypothetical protein